MVTEGWLQEKDEEEDDEKSDKDKEIWRRTKYRKEESVAMRF